MRREPSAAAASMLTPVMERVAARHGISLVALRVGVNRPNCDARHSAFWVASQRGFSLHEIAAWFDLDHTSVIHGLRRMETLLAALVAEGEA